MKSASSQGQLMLSIGALLAAEREKRGIPVEKAAKETRMRPQRIRDMESDDLSHFTNPSYARMFIIAYAKYLGIPMQTIREHLPDLGQPGTEGYQYISATPDELPSLRRDLVSRPLRRGWLPGVMVGALICLVLAVIAGVTFLVINLPRLSSTEHSSANEPEPDNAPVMVTKVVVVEQPHLENLPAAEPKPVDPVAPSVLNAASATPTPAPFTEPASITAPPRPKPVVTLGADPASAESPPSLQAAVPTPTPEEDEDRTFLLNSENEQTIPAN